MRILEMRWSLDALYQSFDSEEFQRDMKRCENEIKEIIQWSGENFTTYDHALEKIEAYIKRQNHFFHLYTRLLSFGELSLSVSAKDERALRIVEQLEAKETELAKPMVMFQKWIGGLENLEEVIASSGSLKEHAFYLMEIKKNGKYLLSEAEEILIAKMKNTGSNAWSKLQELLSSTLLVDIHVDGEDKKLPLPVVRNMAYAKDSDLRKKAYEAELKSYEKVAESSGASLNGIKGEVITLSKMRGYGSVLEKTLMDSRMDQETLDAMLTAMVESLPAFHRYYRKKAELLGHENGLPFYDMFAPMGDVKMEFTYEEAKDFIVKNFRSFSDVLADYADHAFEKGWIDAEPREGKRGGAFCSNLHVIKESRILSNFTGTFNDVSTLAHEIGHGYHGHCLNEESYLNSDYPMPIAETASIFCETIIQKAALKEASAEERFAILESSLMGAGQVIVDIYSRFLFESELFKRREEGSLSVEELKEIMVNAQKQAYGNGLDHNILHPYMWVCKPHYYYASANFYNFPYAFGLLFAKGLYAEYLKRGTTFVQEYDQLLAITGKRTIADVAATMGIDIRKIDFWRSSLKIIEEDIETFISLKK
ncbi:M3 family oligoendopeptidase [Anaerosolibacter sp.]|jgi:pepF/M3 family oligoendopeptidase|uniref:M3 family oligoendopeptidase n=1 Tax=Anaerosolibacter sp. TaxID=1872527 RepID=UPI002613C3D6|nr:M3 family oligoendopeptidase [Anaerosolibacter sp.]